MKFLALTLLAGALAKSKYDPNYSNPDDLPARGLNGWSTHPIVQDRPAWAYGAGNGRRKYKEIQGTKVDPCHQFMDGLIGGVSPEIVNTENSHNGIIVEGGVNNHENSWQDHPATHTGVGTTDDLQQIVTPGTSSQVYDIGSDAAFSPPHAPTGVVTGPHLDHGFETASYSDMNFIQVTEFVTSNNDKKKKHRKHRVKLGEQIIESNNLKKTNVQTQVKDTSFAKLQGGPNIISVLHPTGGDVPQAILPNGARTPRSIDIQKPDTDGGAPFHADKDTSVEDELALISHSKSAGSAQYKICTAAFACIVGCSASEITPTRIEVNTAHAQTAEEIPTGHGLDITFDEKSNWGEIRHDVSSDVNGAEFGDQQISYDHGTDEDRHV